MINNLQFGVGHKYSSKSVFSVKEYYDVYLS